MAHEQDDDQAQTIPARPTREREPGRRLLEKGTALGRYVILERLGSGGMSEVYAAFDPHLDRRVAIKLLRPDVVAGMPAEEGRARVLREAQALARLSHPNVVAVHDVGQEGGEIFIAMEYVDGVTARTWLADAPRTWKEVLSVFLDAGRGLASAHEAGLVHRDFKPDNVLVTPAGRVVVLDFGLARAAGGPEAPASVPTEPGRRAPPPVVHPLDTPLTRVGDLMGTPRYMSPEQLTASAVDARSDQFSFCVALYEALHGSRPFSGDQVEDLLRQIRSGALPPRSQTPAPAWLDALLEKGLSADPDNRFESMQQLLRALERDPAAARRRVGRLAVGAVTLAAAFAGTTAALRVRDAQCKGGETRLDGVWDGKRRDVIRRAFAATADPLAASAFAASAEALDAYRQRWGLMWTDACEAATLRGEQSPEVRQLRMSCLDHAKFRLDALVSLFAQADKEVVRGAAKAAHSLQDVSDCGDVQRLQTVAPLPRDPAAAARAEALRKRLAEAEARRMAGKVGEATELAAATVAEARALGHPGLLAEALYLQGRAEEDAGHSKAAADALEGAAQAAISAKDDVRLVWSWGLLASVVALREARPQDARRWTEYARAVIPRLASPTHAQSEIERAAAVIDYVEGRYAEALAGFQRASTLKRAAGLGMDALELVQIENNVAVLLGQLGRSAEAREHHERVLVALRKLHGPEHPAIATSLDNLGIVLTDLGEFDAAERTQREGLAIRERSYPEGSPDVAKSLNNLGRALNMSGRYAEAREVLQRALKVTRATDGPDHPMSAWVLHNLGNAALALHDPKQALMDYGRAYEVLAKGQGPKHPDTALFLVGIAHAELALKRPERAQAALDRADDAFRPEDATPQDLAEAKFLRAQVLRALRRDPAMQRALAEEASSLYDKAGPAWRDEMDEVRAFLDSGRPRP